MTTVQKRLVQAYATLVMAGRMRIEDITDADIILRDGGTKSSMRAEIEVEIARRTVETLEDAH